MVRCHISVVVLTLNALGVSGKRKNLGATRLSLVLMICFFLLVLDQESGCIRKKIGSEGQLSQC